MNNFEKFLEMLLNIDSSEDDGNRPHDCKISARIQPKPKPKVKVREVNNSYILELHVEKFIYDGKKTTVVYIDLDGNKQTTNSICGNSDKYDREVGENICLLKALSKESVKKLNSY